MTDSFEPLSDLTLLSSASIGIYSQLLPKLETVSTSIPEDVTDLTVPCPAKTDGTSSRKFDGPLPVKADGVCPALVDGPCPMKADGTCPKPADEPCPADAARDCFALALLPIPAKAEGTYSSVVSGLPPVLPDLSWFGMTIGVELEEESCPVKVKTVLPASVEGFCPVKADGACPEPVDEPFLAEAVAAVFVLALLPIPAKADGLYSSVVCGVCPVLAGVS